LSTLRNTSNITATGWSFRLLSLLLNNVITVLIICENACRE
jgi:hypothetical protein